MRTDLIYKIGKIVSKNEVSEDEIRSLMILIRKILETKPEVERLKYLILNLFCNWAAHIRITKSNIGLRVLSKINDTLVKMKDSGDGTLIGSRMCAVLFVDLRRELKSFLDSINVDNSLTEDNNLWGMTFITQLIEIIRDVPLSFPSITDLEGTELKIYQNIAKNAIKPGIGVVGIWIANVDYASLGVPSWKDTLCLHIRTADTTTIVIPIVIDVRLR